jgi:CubicO group peptidase (beta-lactamase class C family)
MIGCNSDDKPRFIVPSQGYIWPSNERSFWPTDEWVVANPADQHINTEALKTAEDFAAGDPLCKALLVVKNGTLVLEKYYHGGARDKSTNLWSVTKSVTSILVGIAIDKGIIGQPSDLMADLMPSYPQFNDITMDDVLTMRTGLAWSETGRPWVEWIFSDDWVTEALSRGQVSNPGKEFKYSSGNTHFLNALIKEQGGVSPGKIAKEFLFDPLGIDFDTLAKPITYQYWDEYKEPLDQTWRRDPNEIETASFGLYLTARDMAKLGFLYLNRGRWEDRVIVSEDWVINSTRDHVTNVYSRYSYGYQWYITLIEEQPAFLASGFGGQIIGIVPSLDLVVVLKYEAENPVHPESGTEHDDMKLFELVAKAAK